MTSSLPSKQPKPTFLSLAVFAFIVHMLISVLVWFSGGDERPLAISEGAFKGLFLPVYLLITSSFYRNLSEFVSLSLFFACWLLSALLWSVLIAGFVVGLQRFRTKSSNQTLQPTAGRSEN